MRDHNSMKIEQFRTTYIRIHATALSTPNDVAATLWKVAGAVSPQMPPPLSTPSPLAVVVSCNIVVENSLCCALCCRCWNRQPTFVVDDIGCGSCKRRRRPPPLDVFGDNM